MANIIVLLCVLFLSVLSISTSVAANKSGYCHEYGIDIKEGDSAPAPIGATVGCALLSCRNAEKNSISALPCGLIAPPGPGCKLSPENSIKLYPDCCAKVVC